MAFKFLPTFFKQNFNTHRSAHKIGGKNQAAVQPETAAAEQRHGDPATGQREGNLALARFPLIPADGRNRKHRGGLFIL